VAAIVDQCGCRAAPIEEKVVVKEAEEEKEEETAQEATVEEEEVSEEVEEEEEVISEEDIYESWKTYINDIYSYQFKYPPEAIVSEAEREAFSISVEERDQGLTADDIYNKYTGKICVYVEYKLGYIYISAPENKGWYVICGRSGLGVWDETTEVKDIEEVITIEDKTYIAEGYEVIGPGETLFFHNEFLWFSLEDGTEIEYGSLPDEEATYQDYLDVKEDLVKIVESYEKI